MKQSKLICLLGSKITERKMNNLFDTKGLMDSLLLQQAVYCKTKNIEIPDILKQRLDNASVEEKAEAEIQMIEAEYLIDEICEGK